MNRWRFLITRSGLVGCLCLGSLAIVGGDRASAQPKTPPANRAEDESGKVVKTDAEWKKLLTREQYRVTRKKGTEQAFQNAFWKSKKDGQYQCICCQLVLFDAKQKFDSGTGWPSFWAPVEENVVLYHEDRSEQEVRTEVVCRRCDAHLGHVFADGPQPTGHRYCMNSAALKFIPREKSNAGGSKSGTPKPK